MKSSIFSIVTLTAILLLTSCPTPYTDPLNNNVPDTLTLGESPHSTSSITPEYTYMSGGLTYVVYNEADFSSDKNYAFMNEVNQDYLKNSCITNQCNL